MTTTYKSGNEKGDLVLSRAKEKFLGLVFTKLEMSTSSEPVSMSHDGNIPFSEVSGIYLLTHTDTGHFGVMTFYVPNRTIGTKRLGTTSKTHYLLKSDEEGGSSRNTLGETRTSTGRRVGDVR